MGYMPKVMDISRKYFRCSRY